MRERELERERGERSINVGPRQYWTGQRLQEFSLGIRTEHALAGCRL